MQMEQIIVISAAISMVSIAPLILIIFYLAKSHKQLLGDYEALKQKQKGEENLIQEAQVTAHKTIEAAAAKAQEIIRSAALFKSDIEQEFKSNLQKASLEQSSNYRNASQEVLQLAIKELNTTSKSTIEQSKSNFVQISNEYAKAVQAQIEEYKKLKLTELNDRIEKALNQAALKIINRSIDTREHEDLVISALEEAKKENGL